MTECGMSGARQILGGYFSAKGGSILQDDAEKENLRTFVSLQLLSFFFFFFFWGWGPGAV